MSTSNRAAHFGKVSRNIHESMVKVRKARSAKEPDEVVFAINCPKDVLESLEELARIEGISPSEVALKALNRYLTLRQSEIGLEPYMPWGLGPVR